MKRSWEIVLRNAVDKPELLVKHADIDVRSLKKVTEIYPMRINQYFINMMKERGDSLARQVVPDPRELEDTIGWIDPLAEEEYSPVPHLTHRYPDRVLFLVSNECGVYCRFCTRKRKIGRWGKIHDDEIEEGFRYIQNNPAIRDVLLSGGDPFLLSNDRLEWILARLKEISHVEIVRIGTRVPVVLPQRVTKSFVRILKTYNPLYVNIHFNHPDEITSETEQAVSLMVDEGILLGSQTVLLRGINDNPGIISELMKKLLTIRVRPYYLLQMDLVRGADHFRSSIETGLRIMQYLRGNISGLAVPTYVIDLPGGGGKVPLLPEYIVEKNDKEIVFKNYQGGLYRYPKPAISRIQETTESISFV